MTKTERENRNKRMIISVLDGMTFDQAAEACGFKSRQAAKHIFDAHVLTPVRFFGSQEIEKIKAKGNNITAMREQWSKPIAARFK